MARRGRGRAQQPPHNQGYGNPPYGQPGYGGGYGPPGYGPPGSSIPGQPGPGGPPPRRSKIRPILGWTGVVVGGIISTVLATMIVDAVTGKNDKKSSVAGEQDGEQGPALPEGYIAPEGPPVVNGPKFNSTADPRSWPDACDMFTDVELKHADSEATPRRREGRKYDGSARGNERPMRNVSCTIEVALPNLERQSSPATIKIGIQAIGDPEEVKAAFLKEKTDDGQKLANSTGAFEDLENRFGVDSAYRNFNTLHLQEGGYWVSLELKADTKDTQGTDESRYAWLKKVGPSLVAVLNVKMQND